MRRRRLSTNPENVKRRFANRIAQALAVLIIAGGYYVWNTYIAPVNAETRVQPESAAQTAVAAESTAVVAESTVARDAATDARTDIREDGARTVHRDKSNRHDTANDANAKDSTGAALADALYERQASNEIITVTSTVKRVLPDDNKDSRHQRFILNLPSGRTLLVAHNIDLAPRVDGIQTGDTVTVRGEYEWEERGGVLHWTHHDPAGRHQGGWIEFDGKKYE